MYISQFVTCNHNKINKLFDCFGFLNAYFVHGNVY